MTDLQIVCEALGMGRNVCGSDKDYCTNPDGNGWKDGGGAFTNCKSCEHRAKEYPDTLTPELAWEIETRARTQYSIEVRYGHEDIAMWGYDIYDEQHRYITTAINKDRATALISALSQAIGGE